MAEMLMETYLRQQVEKGEYGVAIIQAQIALDIADYIEKHRQPDRKTGRWIWNPNGMDWNLGAWCCSECKFKAETWWASDEKYNPLMCSGGTFCGNCGARMNGGEVK